MTDKAARDTATVRFPEDCVPKGAPVYVFNELHTQKSPEAIWEVLIDALVWPEFYKNCKRPALDAGHERLQAGTTFHWTTFGVRVHTTIEEFEPHERLAWRGVTPGGGSAYHGWVIEKTATGCRIVTEETQRGVVPWLGRWFLRGAMHKQHQRWFEGLAGAAK